MAIDIEKSFTLDASVDAVWAFLTDPHRVAQCLPGASITEQVDEATFKGKMNVKVGPVASSYKGTITFDRLDEATHTAEMSGRGQDVRGKGGAEMKMTSTVKEHVGGSTEVSVMSSLNVTGILAQMGRGMIQDVSDQMFQVFTERMRAELAKREPPEGKAESAPESPAQTPRRPPPPRDQNETLDVGALGAAAGARAAGRLLTRPEFWIAVVIIGIVIYFVLR
jgi:carbon monoxide dehydrogenase subunit G